MDYSEYFKNYTKSINEILDNVDSNLIEKSVKIINKIIKQNKRIFIIGNGGSASIASHVSVDFAKVARVSSSTFNNSNLITCFANDYKYENWVAEAIKAYCDNKDLIILISSSGKSKNIVNAAKYCQKKKINLITLSGFNKNNPLSKLGLVNFYINSKNYNFIEMSHHIILLSIVDFFANPLSKGRRTETDGDGERIQGVQAHVPLRSGMEYPRKGKPLTPIKETQIKLFLC